MPLKLLKHPSVRVGLVILLLLTVGLSRIDHYGHSSDEYLEIMMVRWNHEFITENTPIGGDLRHYGTVFNFLTQFLYEIKIILFGEADRFGSYGDPDWLTYNATQFKHLAAFKHGFIFIFSMVAYLSVAGIVSRLIGGAYAWIGPVALFFFPRFWGHSFFNPKDIPFAAMLTLGTYMGGYLLEKFTQAEHNPPVKSNNRRALGTAYGSAALYGCLVGLITGVRIGGLFLLGFVLLVHVATRLPTWLSKKQLSSIIPQIIGLYGLMVGTWFLTTTIVHPSAWANPVGWLTETLAYMSNHTWSGTVLFAGEQISAISLPWSYLPTWLLITTPLFISIAIGTGLLFAVLHYKTMNPHQKALTLLVLLQIAFFPTVAILKQSTLYDGIRQFLFVMPAAAVIATLGIVWLYQTWLSNQWLNKILSRKTVSLSFLILSIVIASPTAIDVFHLHPYEYVYFNRFFGGLPSAQGQYDTDYWGLSMRAGMEWINEVSGRTANVVSSSQLISSAPFADDTMPVISYKEFEQNGMETPFYYIARPRWSYHEQFPDCDVVYSVVRQTVPLTIVKRCN
ncbi:MAG: hypothetical protein AAGA83_14665 [Cyanobacteria bacterium P01_F01_bin.116]